MILIHSTKTSPKCWLLVNKKYLRITNDKYSTTEFISKKNKYKSLRSLRLTEKGKSVILKKSKVKGSCITSKAVVLLPTTAALDGENSPADETRRRSPRLVSTTVAEKVVEGNGESVILKKSKGKTSCITTKAVVFPTTTTALEGENSTAENTRRSLRLVYKGKSVILKKSKGIKERVTSISTEALVLLPSALDGTRRRSPRLKEKVVEVVEGKGKSVILKRSKGIKQVELSSSCISAKALVLLPPAAFDGKVSPVESTRKRSPRVTAKATEKVVEGLNCKFDEIEEKAIDGKSEKWMTKFESLRSLTSIPVLMELN